MWYPVWFWFHNCTELEWQALDSPILSSNSVVGNTFACRSNLRQSRSANGTQTYVPPSSSRRLQSSWMAGLATSTARLPRSSDAFGSWAIQAKRVCRQIISNLIISNARQRANYVLCCILIRCNYAVYSSKAGILYCNNSWLLTFFPIIVFLKLLYKQLRYRSNTMNDVVTLSQKIPCSGVWWLYSSRRKSGVNKGGWFLMTTTVRWRTSYQPDWTLVGIFVLTERRWKMDAIIMMIIFIAICVVVLVDKIKHIHWK